MKRSERFSTRVSVLGIDGSGKSTAAHRAATSLSETYKNSDIRVVDSGGLRFYQGGELINVVNEDLEKIKAPAESGSMSRISRTAIFTFARQRLEKKSLKDQNSLTIGVRDPFRIDPAVYLNSIAKETGISPERRINIFDFISRVKHPDHLTLIDVDVNKAYGLIEKNRGALESHETPENLRLLNEDLYNITSYYCGKYALRSSIIDGLEEDTDDALAMNLEEFVIKK